LVPATGTVRAHLGAADIEFTPDDETVAIVESWPRVLSGGQPRRTGDGNLASC
jgi:hypothetical protein